MRLNQEAVNKTFNMVWKEERKSRRGDKYK